MILNSIWTEFLWAPSPSAFLRVAKPQNSSSLQTIRSTTAADDEGSTGAFVKNNGGGSEGT